MAATSCCCSDILFSNHLWCTLINKIGQRMTTKEHKAAIYLKQDEIPAESKCRLQNVSNMWYGCLDIAANHLRDYIIFIIFFSHEVRLEPTWYCGLCLAYCTSPR
jgi:hypothetical protein